jgi:subtilisin family serine protease
MKRSLALLLPLALVACQDANQPVGPVDAPPSAALQQGSAGDNIPGQYIVVFNNGVADAPGLARRLAQQQGGEAFYTYEHAVKGFAFRGSDQAAAALARNPNVAYVEQDQVMRAIATQSDATWGLDRIDARSGLDTKYTYNVTGSGVSSYVIDTGILLTHQDFGGRAFTGFDAITSGGTATDCNGHGTHVAGTMGGTTWGVAKATSLYAVRVLDCNGSGTNSGVIAGVDWVTANHVKPAVANMSLGGGASTALDDAVSNSIAAGVSYSVAAGNGDRLGRQVDACTVSPARVPNAMTIGATTNTDAKTSWSNYGNCVDWFAPGASITSAWYTSNTATNTISGTSMAAPHVAGAAALYLEANKTATPQQVRDALYEATTKGIVTSSSTTNNHLLYTLSIGSGGGGGDTNSPPAASFTKSCADLTCGFTDTSTDSDGTIASWAWAFGDGATSTAQSPSHSYAAGGTYTVSLTVKDNAGATSTTSQSVTVSSGSTTSISLSTTGSKVKGVASVDLKWSGASTGVDIFRNGSKIVSNTANDGAHTDSLGRGASGTFTYKVCNTGTTTCSNESSVTF